MEHERSYSEKNAVLVARVIEAVAVNYPDDLPLQGQERIATVVSAELFRLTSLVRYLKELPEAPKIHARTRHAPLFGDVQNVISMYNIPVIWCELVNTFSEIRHCLAESRAYKDQEASCADPMNSAFRHLHHRKMQSFNWAIVQLVRIDDLVFRLLQECTSGRIVSFRNTKWELQLKWKPTEQSLNQLHESGELSDHEFNGIMTAVNECFQAASGQFIRQYRDRVIHSVTPSVDIGILYSRLYDRTGEVTKDEDGNVVKTTYGFGGLHEAPAEFQYVALYEKASKYLSDVSKMLSALKQIPKLA